MQANAKRIIHFMESVVTSQLSILKLTSSTEDLNCFQEKNLKTFVGVYKHIRCTCNYNIIYYSIECKLLRDGTRRNVRKYILVTLALLFISLNIKEFGK